MTTELPGRTDRWGHATPAETTRENACPFNTLYWDFLKRNEETLRGTGRMGLMDSHVDRKDGEEWGAIRERAAEGDL